MPAYRKQSIEEARDIIIGYEKGDVASTKPLYTNGKTAVLAGHIRSFLAENKETIVGFEGRVGLGNTYVHALAKAKQIQVGTFARIADAMKVKPLDLYYFLVNKTTPAPVPVKEDTQPQESSMGEVQIIIPNVPHLGDVVLNTADQTYHVFKALRVVTKS